MNESYQNDPRITDYVMQAMSEAQRDAFEQELAADPRLAQAVQQASQLIGQLSAMYAAETTEALAPQRRESILDAAKLGPDRATVPPLAPPVAPPIAVADQRSWLSVMAMVVPMLVVVAVLMYSARQDGPVVAQSELREEAGEADEALGDAPIEEASMNDPFAETLSAELSSELLEEQPEVATEPEPAAAAAVHFAMGDAPPSPSAEGTAARDETPRRPASPAYNQPSDELANGAVRERRKAQGLAAPQSSPLPSRTRTLPQPGTAYYSDLAIRDSQIASGGEAKGMGNVELSTTRGMGGMHMDMDMGGMGGGMGVEGMGMEGMGMEGMGMEGMGPGMGPGMGGDQFEPITDNPFQRVDEQPLSTFSIDVDTASYSKVRSYLRQNHLPRPDAVRIEELINYFDYDYSGPGNEPAEDGDTADATAPFKADVEIAGCPWTPKHRLVRVGIKGREIENDRRPASNLVFLLDVSGSMNQANKLPLVKRGMQMLLDQLGENDRVAIVVYASATGLVLDSTPADQHATIFEALERLSAGGSTNGGDGIRLAYRVARDHFIAGGVNRVLLCTDGDFNVGTTGTDELVRLVEQESKGGIFVSVLGFGMGNHNDSMLEQISNKGNGNYAFIDTAAEAHKVFVKQTNSTLVTIAKDVKIQVEFNPQEVSAYRLIGYENRMLAKEDFNDDTIDAGEIGAGHTVTALYEVVPQGEQAEPIAPAVDALRYQRGPQITKHAASGELLTLKLRYKLPEGESSTLMQFPVSDQQHGFGEASNDFQFASAVAGFGMQLRNSPYKGQWTLAAVSETAESAVGEDAHGLRAEFIELVQKAAALKGE